MTAPAPALHALASELRRRSGPALAPVVAAGPARRDARRLLPRGRNRRPCARRAERPPARDPDPGPVARRRSRRPRSRPRSGSGSAARSPTTSGCSPSSPPAPSSCCALQPGALRRPAPLRRLVRARLGRLPAPDRVLRVRRAARLGGRARGGLRRPVELRAAPAVEPGPPAAPAGRVRHRHGRAGRTAGASRSPARR